VNRFVARMLDFAHGEKPSLLLGTSISDSELLGYLGSVKNAVANPESLVNFRADPSYQNVLEHVSKNLGQKYLEEIMANYNPTASSVFAELSDLSVFGNPPVYAYADVGTVSPTIIRYVKVAYEIKSIFGDPSNLKIGEIGVGFGGQAAVLDRLFGVKEYVAFDLPEVLSLFEIFLTNTSSRLRTQLVDGREPLSVDTDLLISNYAFSELSRTTQDQYLEKVIPRAKAGYMIWNDLSYRNLDGYSLKELLRKTPGSRILKEVPITARGNRLIVWGESLRLPKG